MRCASGKTLEDAVNNLNAYGVLAPLESVVTYESDVDGQVFARTEQVTQEAYDKIVRYNKARHEHAAQVRAFYLKHREEFERQKATDDAYAADLQTKGIA